MADHSTIEAPLFDHRCFLLTAPLHAPGGRVTIRAVLTAALFFGLGSPRFLSPTAGTRCHEQRFGLTANSSPNALARGRPPRTPSPLFPFPPPAPQVRLPEDPYFFERFVFTVDRGRSPPPAAPDRMPGNTDRSGGDGSSQCGMFAKGRGIRSTSKSRLHPAKKLHHFCATFFFGRWVSNQPGF